MSAKEQLLSADVIEKRKAIMESILRFLCLASLTNMVLCSIPRPLVVDTEWPGGAKVHATIRPPIPIKDWVLHLHFDRPTHVQQVWNGKVISERGRDVDIRPVDYDSRISAGDEFEVGFIISGDHHSGLYYTTYIPDGDANAFWATTLKLESTTLTTLSTTSPSSTHSSSMGVSTTSTTASPSPTPTATTKTTTRKPPPSTQTVPIVSTTTPQVSSTTTPLSAVFGCDKFSAVRAVGLHLHTSSAGANDCKDGVSGSNEDFVLAMCKVREPKNWRRGPQVTQYCHQLPLYTPVATFSSSDVYSPHGAQSGLFVGCLPNGFKLITQHCGGNPVIEHVEQGGIFTQDPNQYFAIV